MGVTAVEPAPPSVESNGPVGLEAILTLEQLTSRRSSEEDVTTLTPTNLGDLAAAANREHLACEQAYASAIEHAFRTGEHLLAAKKEGEHGQWIPWLERHFVGSYRTAAGYMRLARTGNVQRVADLSLRDALQLLAKPRESGPTDETEEVDAEPATTPSASIFDRLRAAGDLGEAETALRRENARRAETGFPRSGMERKTFRDIHSAIAAAQRSLDLVKRHELSNWSRAEALDGAARELREAGELAGELASVVRAG